MLREHFPRLPLPLTPRQTQQVGRQRGDRVAGPANITTGVMITCTIFCVASLSLLFHAKLGENILLGVKVNGS